ncbi:hypothetical protein C0992_001298 [Termitomyces sp. T32_za158]|nr:hypothetical protein C0992_001298 [Termitomyces sp. T32_za158]
MAYPGYDEPLPYQTPIHLQMDVDEEGRYERQEEEGATSGCTTWGQASLRSYARAVAQPLVEEYAPQAQMSMGMEMLLGCLKAAGQPVPAMASFLQDNLAVMVMEGLLDQIELMRRQRVTALEQIDCAAKRKLPGYEGPSPVVVLTTSTLPVRPPAAPVQAAPTVSWAPEVPLAELSLEQQDEEMINAPFDWDEMVLVGAIEAGTHTRVPILQAAGPSTRGLAMSSHAPAMQGPSRPPWGHKPSLKIADMELMDFLASVPAQSEAVQLIFMLPIVVPAPAAQFDVVLLATDPRTPAQYDGMMAEAAKTAAASKGKQQVVPTEEDNSDYEQLSSEQEEEEEEGEMATQHFQRVQRNKKLAKKKANTAQAAAALAHRAQNDFSGRIPDGLGVKIWGLLNVEQLNSCFRRALGPSFYYSYQTNTVFVGADANRAAAYEFGSGRAADTPQTMVYKFARRGFPCTPYELEQLHKYCANPHVPHRNCIVVFMLLIEMRSFAQHLDTVLQDRTMQILLDNPIYWDIPNPITRPEDMAFVKCLHIPMRFLHTKDDGMTVLHVMRAPDPKKMFNLKQLAQYTLIYGQPGLENTWQGIAVDFTYRMHWRTLFGFALCRALCANSAGKTMLVQRFALVMV